MSEKKNVVRNAATTTAVDSCSSCSYPSSIFLFSYSSCAVYLMAYRLSLPLYSAESSFNGAEYDMCRTFITFVLCCSLLVYTTGGNAGGTNCVFPFTFEGAQYYSWITGIVDDNPWCATTANYDQDGLWANVISKSKNIQKLPFEDYCPISTDKLSAFVW